jgi:hypothetical protein
VRIISGGQTGVDRAALDVALKHGIACGGWCPAGRLDEFGRIPDRYPVKELDMSNKEGRSPDRPGALETPAPLGIKRDVFAERTLQNVKDSDGTIVIYFNELRGGTEQTVRFCVEQQRPQQLIDASKISTEDAAKLVINFVRKHKIGILNVAGPRQSEWPEGYEYSFRALEIFMTSVA